MIATPAMMGMREVELIARFWHDEIPTDRSYAQLREICDNLLDVYKVAVVDGAQAPTVFEPSGAHDHDLIAYMAGKSGYPPPLILDFLFSLESTYIAGNIDIHHYDPQSASEVRDVLEELEPGFLTQITAALSPLGKPFEAGFTKLLVAGGIVAVVVFLGRDVIRKAMS